MYWSQESTDAPWVAIGDMSGRLTVTETARRVTDAGLSEARLIPAPAGTLLFAMYASVGEVSELGMPAVWNQALLGITPQPGVSGRFLKYSLMALRPSLSQFFRSNTQNNLNAEQVGQLEVPVPAFASQTVIADYLDRETARIGELIAEQAALIESLAERRTAAVLDAVSDGAKATSGPRLKHVLSGVRQGWSPQCENVPATPGRDWAVLKTGCVNRGVFRPSENKKLPDDLQPRPDTVVQQGEVLVCRASTRDLVGSAAVADGEFPRLMLSDKLYALDVDPRRALPDFVALRLGTDRLRGLIELQASGASHSMQNITQAAIINLPMDLPPVEDQRRALDRLAGTTSKLDALTTECRDLIALLKERRSALITAAATGKIDVRDAVDPG